EAFGPRDVERVVEQWGHALDEVDRVRQPAVPLEGRLVRPARVDVEEPRIARRAKRVDGEAARLLARRPHDVAERVRHRALLPGPRVKAREDEELHHSQYLRQSMRGGTSRQRRRTLP